MTRILIGAAVTIALVLQLIGATALAKEPVITYQFPWDGAILAERPPAIQLCFTSAIDVRDLDKGGEFRFAAKAPDGTQLGHRAIFQPNGLGVVVQPGIPDEAEGDWTFEWQVRDRETEEATEGTIRFSVAEGGDPVISADPPPCTSETTPAPAGSPRATVEPDGKIEPEEGDGPDVLLLALLTTGAAAAAGGVALIGYFVRRRIDYEPHRPSEHGDGDEPHH